MEGSSKVAQWDTKNKQARPYWKLCFTRIISCDSHNKLMKSCPYCPDGNSFQKKKESGGDAADSKALGDCVLSPSRSTVSGREGSSITSPQKGRSSQPQAEAASPTWQGVKQVQELQKRLKRTKGHTTKTLLTIITSAQAPLSSTRETTIVSLWYIPPQVVLSWLPKVNFYQVQLTTQKIKSQKFQFWQIL